MVKWGMDITIESGGNDMKKLTAILLTLALIVCGMAAAAESDYTYFPESEEYVGTWYADDAILEIVHMDDDYNLFTCVVTKYASEREGVRWIYDDCSYDDVGRALSSFEIGAKFDVRFDENGDLLSSEPVYYEDGAASFALNEDGTLTWTDFKETPGQDELVFQKVERFVANPVAAYEGEWTAGRAALTIEDLDDVITCTIRWGGSAFDEAVWEYACVYDEAAGGLSAPESGVKSIVTYGEGGEGLSTEVEYDDGAATFVIDDAGSLVWTNIKEDSVEMLFEKVGGLTDYSGVTTMDRAEIEAFAERVRDACLKGDWAALAPLIDYPITIAPGQEIATPQDFAAYMFDKAFTDEDLAAMEEEDCRDLFVNGEGICLGSGQVWLIDVNFDGVEQVGEPLLRIIALNGIE